MKPKVKKMMQREDVRPHRLVGLRESSWILGDIIEVFYHNLWRPGKIIKVLKNDYFVIRLTCIIQLKEFHISCLRAPQANHGKQSSVIDKDCRGSEEDGHRTKRCKSSKICPSSATRVVMKLKTRRTRPDGFIRVTGKTTKAAAYEVHQPNKKVLPLKVSARNGIDGDCLYRPLTRSLWEDRNVHRPSLSMDLHDLELQAYQSTVRAFYASGPLTWEQESLLTNLRLSLNISNEENLLHLSYAVSTQISEQWMNTTLREERDSCKRVLDPEQLILGSLSPT
ncbi:hypothetical protein QOZ80_7BG0589230 [Eleusine coracana subsp. coracana]|nr:hypothetical protein QOZ80_7BG0589230 [Eleusine coracana subsp. coracana]